jgi:acyl-CoA reductase-like NAD-dependent aldehyde dehydrogenase
MFIKEVRKIKVGLPSDPDTCLTPVLKIKEFYEFLEDATSKGAEILYGGDRIDHLGNVDPRGSFINPTVVSIQNNDDFWNIKCLREENFFPLLPLVKVGGLTDDDIFSKMTATINGNPYGLRASVWVRSSFYTRRFVRHIHNSGLLRINSRHVDFSSFLSTHGGTGRTGGPYGELNYIWQKTTHLQGISLMREKYPKG